MHFRTSSQYYTIGFSPNRPRRDMARHHSELAFQLICTGTVCHHTLNHNLTSPTKMLTYSQLDNTAHYSHAHFPTEDTLPPHTEDEF